MLDFPACPLARLVDFLASDIPGCKTPTPYWLAWLLVAGFNLFINVMLWRDWEPKEDDSRLELLLRRVNAWGIITWPISGFVLIPAMFAAAVVYPSWLLLRAIVRGTYRIASEVVSVAAGERE